MYTTVLSSLRLFVVCFWRWYFGVHSVKHLRITSSLDHDFWFSGIKMDLGTSEHLLASLFQALYHGIEQNCSGLLVARILGSVHLVASERLQ